MEAKGKSEIDEGHRSGNSKSLRKNNKAKRQPIELTYEPEEDDPFMRPITQEAYGIPPEQVVGSSVVTEFQLKDGKGDLVRMPKIDFINDKATKPVGPDEKEA